MKPLLLLMSACLVAWGDGAVVGKFKMFPTTLDLAPGKADGKVKVRVWGTGLKFDSKKNVKPTLVDSGAPFSSPVVVKASIPADSPAVTDPSLDFDISVANFPVADTQSRAFTISYGDIHETLPYTLTNMGGKTFTWSVKAPGEWNLSTMHALPLTIHTGDLPATSVGITQADFASDDKLKNTIGKQNFELCVNAPPEGCEEVPTPVPARTLKTFYLRSKGDLPIGTLKGNVSVFANEKTEADSLPVIIYSPLANGLWWGVGFLSLGVLLSAVMQFGLRWFTRNREAKEVVLLLRKRVADLKSEFEKLSGPVQTGASRWSQRLAQLTQDLADDKIDPLMRPLVPQPINTEIEQLDTFKTTMEALGATFSYLRTLLRSGLQSVDALATDHPGDNPDQATAIAAAVKDAAGTVALILPEAIDVPTQIGTALTTLKTAIRTAGATGKPSLSAAPTPASTPQDELRSISAQLLAANLVALIFWGVVSVLSGALTMIFQNPSFGTKLDLFLCLVWGLGISLAGGQTPQVTPSSIAGTLGVKLPGAK